MTGPQYVIVHHVEHSGRAGDEVYDIRPSPDRGEMLKNAAELQYDAQNLYGRPKDTYRVAELRYVDEEG